MQAKRSANAPMDRFEFHIQESTQDGQAMIHAEISIPDAFAHQLFEATPNKNVCLDEDPPTEGNYKTDIGSVAKAYFSGETDPLYIRWIDLMQDIFGNYSERMAKEVYGEDAKISGIVKVQSYTEGDLN